MDFSESGPVDIYLLRFSGVEFRVEVPAALRNLAVRGLIRVIDLLFVFRTTDGEVGWIDLEGLRPEVDPHFVGLEGHLGGGLLDLEDVDEVAPSLENDSSVAVVVVENLWASPFITAVRQAGGEVVDRARMSSSLLRGPRVTVAGHTGEQ
jgi:hypothetical protein